MITICNVLCIDNSDFLDDLIARLISNTWNFSVLKSNILHGDNDNSDTETECIENNSVLNNKSISENNVRNDFGTTKNEMAQLLIHDTLFKTSINCNTVKNMITAFENNSYQNIEKWIDNFEDIISLFNLSDLHKLILVKRKVEKKIHF